MHAAKLLGGEIVNADATQIYADLRLLSARPSDAEMSQAPHHLFGTMDGAQSCSAAQWAALATEAIHTVWARGAVPIVVGGTGLYLRTLLEGIAEVPEILAAVRESVRALDPEALTAALERLDPEAAARINPNDRQRRARALEVVLGTGKSLKTWQQGTSGGLEFGVALKLALMPPRDLVYGRCDARLDAMVANGVLDEVQKLMTRQLDPNLPVMKAVGMPEFEAFLRGMCKFDDALSDAKLATRHYAKRQYTWINNQFVDWERIESTDSEEINQKLAILLRKYVLTVK